MAITAPAPEDQDDLLRQQLVYFADICSNKDAGEYADWERRANGLDEMLVEEKFYLRFIEKNFDGVLLNRWIVFCSKPRNDRYRVDDPIFTVMTIENPGESGSFSTPQDVHLEALSVMITDWRGGRHAALERLEGMKTKAQERNVKDALNEAEGLIDDVVWIWKRAMGEDMSFRLGPDGTGPNYGGKPFGQAFDRVS